MIALLPLFILNIAGLYFSDKFKIESSISYSILLMLSLDIMYFASLINLLLPVTIVLFLVLTLVGILAIVKIYKKQITPQKDLYLTLNNISAVVFAIIFSIQKPLVYYWDEIRLWGPSAKSVKLFNQLYSIDINPTTVDRNYPVGNSILNYFFSFFSKDFADYLLLLSYALMYFAVFSVIARVIYKKTNNHKLAIGSYFLLLLSPFASAFHSVSKNFMNVSYAYGTTMVDFNLAVVFAMVIAFYLWDRNSKWFILPEIFLITIKKNGIFLALLAFCIIVCFELFSFKSEKWNIKKAFSTVLISLIVPIIAYGSWFAHLNFFETEIQPSQYNLKDETPMTRSIDIDIENAPKSVDKSETSLRAIFVPSLRTERYNEILSEMKWYFANNKETIYMKDKFLIVFLLVLGLYSAIKQNKNHRLPIILISLGLTLGCFVYNIIIAYQMQFYNDMMVEYPRYMLSYYFSWIYVIFALFMLSPNIKDNVKQLFLTVCLVFTLGSVAHTGLVHTVISGPDNVFQQQLEIKEKTDAINKVIEKGSRIYLVYPDADGSTYNNYKYHFLPSLVSVDCKNTGIDFSINFREKLDYESGKTYYNIANKETFTNIMSDYFDYIYVVKPDAEFKNDYSRLFSDGLTKGTLYKITDNEVPMQAVTI